MGPLPGGPWGAGGVSTGQGAGQAPPAAAAPLPGGGEGRQQAAVLTAPSGQRPLSVLIPSCESRPLSAQPGLAPLVSAPRFSRGRRAASSLGGTVRAEALDLLASGWRLCSRARFPLPAVCPAPSGPWHWLPTPVCPPGCGPLLVERAPPAGALQAVTGRPRGSRRLVTSGSSGRVVGPALWEVTGVLVCCVRSSWHKLPGLISAPAGIGKGCCPWPRLTPALAALGTRCSC